MARTARRQRSPRKTEPLPKHLRLTPERKARIAEQQAALRERALERGRLTPEAQRVQLGLAHEKSARADVAMLESELVGLAADAAADATLARLQTARQRLAEALAQQGRYDEAATVAPDAEQAQHYERLWEAVWRDDTESCECEPFRDGEMSLTHDHVAEEILSLNHNRIMPLVKCNCCGFLNARPLPPALRQLQRAQLEAARLVQGYTPAQLKTQARELLADLRDGRVLK